jgi:CheY-like chemotaxis protein
MEKKALAGYEGVRLGGLMDDLVTLRMLVAAAASPERDALREAAALSALPLDVTEAENGSKAAAMIDGGQFDLVLLDCNLPESDRTRAAKAARESEKPAFVIGLAGAGQSPEPHWADAAARRPSNIEDAKKLIGGCVRARLPLRVLVVDDSSTMRGIVRKILTATRFKVEVSEADNGAAAFAHVKNSRVDIVFLDYNMPGLDGVATLTALKLEKSGVRVIIITSSQDAALAERARAAGADGFLKKPFYPADIDDVLHRLCGLRPVIA